MFYKPLFVVLFMQALNFFAQEIGMPLWLLAVVFTWSAIWKGIALWKSARNNHLFWFVLILLINTIGILEILYVFVFSKIKFQDTKKDKRGRNANEIQKASISKNTKKARS